MLKPYLAYIIIYSISLGLLVICAIIEKMVGNSTKETKFTKWWRNNIVGEDLYKNNLKK